MISKQNQKQKQLNTKLASLCKQDGQQDEQQDEIIVCLKNGADPNFLSSTFDIGFKDSPMGCPLHYAIKDPKKVKILLCMGANPNCQDRPTFQTPLQIAAFGAFKESAEILLEHGANAELSCTKGYNALHSAIMAAEESEISTKALEIVKLLLKHGANPDAETGLKTKETWISQRKTPLMLATRLVDAPLFFEELLRAGANPNIRNSNGKDAIDLANPEDREKLKECIKKYRSTHITKILKEYKRNELEII